MGQREKWTVTDFLGNVATVRAGSLEEAIDEAYEHHRLALYGNAPHWSFASESGAVHPIDTDYDRALDELGYFQEAPSGYDRAADPDRYLGIDHTK